VIKQYGMVQRSLLQSFWRSRAQTATTSTTSARSRRRVVPYTIDDEQRMQRVINLGVDGIISDDVDLLLRVAKRNGLA